MPWKPLNSETAENLLIIPSKSYLDKVAYDLRKNQAFLPLPPLQSGLPVVLLIVHMQQYIYLRRNLYMTSFPLGVSRLREKLSKGPVTPTYIRFSIQIFKLGKVILPILLQS